MSGDRLSASTQALLRAARSDAPNATARAKVWSGVSSAVGSAAAGATSLGAAGPASAVGVGMSAAKMLAIGTLLGATVTVGLATMLLYVKPRHGSGTGATARPAVAAMNAAPSVPMPSNITLTAKQPVEPAVLAGSAQLAAFANAEPHLRVTGTAGLAGAEPHRLPSGAVSGTPPLRSLSAHPDLGPRPTTATSPNAVRPNDGSERVGAPGAASGGIVDDALTREASLVAEARALLAAGDAASALRKVRAARAMPSPQLVPEELTVEAQALRSLGMADDARGVDATLHTQYPDSALAR